MFIEIIEKEKYPYTIFFGDDYYRVDYFLYDHYLTIKKSKDADKMKELKSILDGVKKNSSQ